MKLTPLLERYFFGNKKFSASLPKKMTVMTNFPKKKTFSIIKLNFIRRIRFRYFCVGFFSETALVQNILQLGVNFGVKVILPKKNLILTHLCSEGSPQFSNC